MTDVIAPLAPTLLPEDAARRHLLLSFPALDESQSGGEAVDRLVEGAIHHLMSSGTGMAILMVTEVVSAIYATSGLSYESAEVIASLERLERDGHLEFKHAEKRAFVFREKRYRALCADLAYRQERLQAVRREWFDEVRLRHSLADDQLQELWNAIERFTAQMMNTYGAEAAAFLYQGGDAVDDAHQRFADVIGQRMPQLADYVAPALLPVAQSEIQKFFSATSAARVEYLTHCLRGAFMFHLLSIDPTASELIRSNVADKTFYLDTNFVYRLLGFGGPTRAYGPQAVVSMAKALNCHLWIAEETVHEFLRKLRSEVNQLRQHPIQQTAYRRLIADHPGDDYNFMQAFYREFLDGKISGYDQFQRKYENVEAILADYGIKIDHDAELTEEEAKSDAFLDLQSAFNSWTSQDRHPDSVTHDAYMLQLIRSKRGRRDKRAGSIQVWLLTYDRGLTAFSVHKADGEQLPVCLLGDDWLQIARPFLPRTGDYDQSFLALLRNPVTFEDPTVVPLDHMVTALERLDQMQELPAAVIAGMVTDSAMLNRIRLAKDDAMVKQLVEVEAATYAREQELAVSRLTQEKHELRERVEQLEHATGEYRTRSRSVATAAEIAERERDDAREEAKRLRAETPALVEQARRDAEAQVTLRVQQEVQAALKQERDAQRDAQRARNKEYRRWGICAALGISLVVLSVRAFLRLPAFFEGVRGALLVASVGLATYALYRIARHGKGHDAVSKCADLSGLIGYGILCWQSFAPLPPQVAAAPAVSASPAAPAGAGALHGGRAPDSVRRDTPSR